MAQKGLSDALGLTSKESPMAMQRLGAGKGRITRATAKIKAKFK